MSDTIPSQFLTALNIKLNGCVGPYKLEKITPLGKGGFGRVYRAHHKSTKEQVAIKVVEKKLDKKYRCREETAMAYLSKFDCFVNFKGSYSTWQRTFLVMELCDCTLLDVLKRIPGHKLPEANVRDITLQLVEALYYMHKKHMGHFDFKLENILVKFLPNHTIQIKITDFGTTDICDAKLPPLYGQVSTLYVAPPEMLKGEPYSLTADCWALGVIVFSLFAGEMPFGYNDNKKKMTHAIVNNAPKFDGSAWTNVSDLAKDFIMKLLQKNPYERINIKQAGRHPFLHM